MKNKNTWIWWVAGGAAVVVLGSISCCCFTGMLGATRPLPSSSRPTNDSVPPAPAVTSESRVPPPEPAPGPGAPAAAPQPPDACASAEPIEMPPLEREARIVADVLLDESHRARVRVRHNLPLGTALLVSLEGATYTGQSRLEATGPCLISESFSDRGRSLPNGQYTAIVTMPVLGVQPAGVRDAFAPNGQGLRGPQVRRDHGDRFIEVRARFDVGSAAEARAGDANRARGDRQRRERLAQIIQDGRAMRSLRENDSLPGLRACGDRMRQLQGQLRQLRAEAEQVGDDGLAGMTGIAMLCVSCVRDADHHCSNAAGGLRDLERIERGRRR